MPRLKANYSEVLAILLAHGFEQQPTGATSHQQYRGVVEGRVRIVTLAPHSRKADVAPGTLDSIIRQSGLPKKLFRK